MFRLLCVFICCSVVLLSLYFLVPFCCRVCLLLCFVVTVCWVFICCSVVLSMLYFLVLFCCRVCLLMLASLVVVSFVFFVLLLIHPFPLVVFIVLYCCQGIAVVVLLSCFCVLRVLCSSLL